jgi:hypothetical protein
VVGGGRPSAASRLEQTKASTSTRRVRSALLRFERGLSRLVPDLSHSSSSERAPCHAPQNRRQQGRHLCCVVLCSRAQGNSHSRTRFSRTSVREGKAEVQLAFGLISCIQPGPRLVIITEPATAPLPPPQIYSSPHSPHYSCGAKGRGGRRIYFAAAASTLQSSPVHTTTNLDAQTTFSRLPSAFTNIF